MKTMAVLLTVFNRKYKTVRCLERLYEQLPIEGYEVDVYLTNDACTDGTPEIVRKRFPQVKIIDSKGNLYWNRGMYIAWETAAKAKDYNFYLWLNDDSFIRDKAIDTLLRDSSVTNDKAIIVAAMQSEITYETTYSGHNKNGKIDPNGKLQECETFNGNCVLIPQVVFHRVGNLDWTFHHAIGDLDYGYRTKSAGFKIYVSSTYLGYCESNSKLPIWARKEVPFMKRLKNLYSPLGYAEPLPFFHFEIHNFGLLTALKHFVSIHLRVCFPRLWK